MGKHATGILLRTSTVWQPLRHLNRRAGYRHEELAVDEQDQYEPVAVTPYEGSHRRREAVRAS